MPAIPDTRSKNLILFALLESSLLQTRLAIDDMSNHLIGKTVVVLDAFRLGCRNDQCSCTVRPHPLLIKLGSVWDRRLLLASCCKLKGFTDNRLYLREDLPPELREKRNSASAHTVEAANSTSSAVTELSIKSCILSRSSVASNGFTPAALSARDPSS